MDANTLGALTLYLLYRLAGMGVYNVDEEKLVKLLFLALYAEPDGEGFKLRRNPPLLDVRVKDQRGRLVKLEFRVYQRGPYVPLVLLKRLVDDTALRLIGEKIDALRIQRLPNGRVLVGLTEELLRRKDTLSPMLEDLLHHIFGREMLRSVDEIVQRLGRAETSEVTRIALRVLGLDEELKAMVFNTRVDDLIDVKKAAVEVGRELLEGEEFTLDEEWLEANPYKLERTPNPANTPPS